MMNKPLGERPDRDRIDPEGIRRRKISDEAMLAAFVAAFAGVGALVATRSLVDAAVFTGAAFVVSLGVFTVLKLVVVLPERGTTPTATQEVQPTIELRQGTRKP